jgi:hypothetical protein
LYAKLVGGCVKFRGMSETIKVASVMSKGRIGWN